jgi:large subunit ribosomal protein L21
VLLLEDGGTVTVGRPLVVDAVVVAEVVSHGRARKVINFKYKAKTRYRRKRGHRQGFTRLSVRSIGLGAVPDEATEPLAVEEPPSAEPPAGEASAPAPRRRRRATASSEATAQE